MPVVTPPVPCPGCSAPLPPAAGSCGGCGLPLTGPLAGRLWQIDQQLAQLAAERRDVLAGLRAAEPAAPPRARRSGQQLLLGLGVALLLVAAAVFLAVAWQWLGVLGQVGIMAAVTAGAVAAAAGLRRRDLVATAESVSALALGLAALDAAAARSLGLAELDGVADLPYAAGAAALVAAVAAAGSLLDRRLRGFPLAAVAAAALAALLAVVAFEPSPAIASWLLLGSALVAAAGSRLLRTPRPEASLLAAVAATGFAALSAAYGLQAAADGPAATTAVASLPVLVVVLVAAAGWRAARERLLRAAAGSAAALLGALLLVVDVAHAGPGAVVTLGLAGAAAACAAACATGGAARTAARAFGLATSALCVLATLADGTHGDTSVALGALAFAMAVTAAVAGGRRRELSAAAALLVLAAVAHAVDPLPGPWQAGALLVSGLAGAAVAAARRGRPEELPVAVAAALSLCGAVSAAASSPRLLAGVLVAAGLAAFGYALLPGRGRTAAAGVLSCSAASWVLLEHAGVTVVEAYTLPVAALLLAVGLVRLQRWPDAPSWATVGPAASAALLPSASVAASEPTFLRAALVLVAGAGVLLAGVAGRWQAPTVTGAAAVAIVAVSQLAPYAVGAPRWLTLGAVGLLLLAVGARYEQRRSDLEQSARWVVALR